MSMYYFLEVLFISILLLLKVTSYIVFYKVPQYL